MLCQHDQSLIERESAIPGFQHLLQPEQLRDLLLNHSDIQDPGELKLGYLRYKPGINCIARFEFNADGRRHFAYAKAFGEEGAGKLHKAMQRTDTGSSLGPGRVALKDQQILFSVFPNDSRLRSLAKLKNLESRNDLLARLFKSRAGWESASFRALNYKPERRFVACFTNAVGDKAAVKFYSQAEFAKVREYRKHLETTPGVQVPDWIGGSKVHRALAFSWLPGTTLQEHLESPGHEAVSATGRAIASFHAGHQQRLKIRNQQLATSSLKALAHDLGILIPELKNQSGELAQQLNTWLMVQPAPALPIHGDFYTEQMLISQHGVSMIDSDETHLGNPLSDVANFIAHLEQDAAYSGMDANRISDISTALICGYREIRPQQDFDNLCQHIAVCLFRLIHKPFRDRAADWPGQTRALIQRCSELFDSSG